VPAELSSLLVGCVWRVSLLLGIAWGAAALLRRAAASVRHSLWAWTMVAAAMVPVFMTALPPWRLPLPAALDPLAASIIAPSPTRVSPGVQATATAGQGTLPPTPLNGPIASSISSRDAGGPYMRMAAGVWVLGSTVAVAYLFVGLLLAWRLRRSAVPATAWWTHETRSLARALRIHGPISFAESARTPGPAVCGLWHPTIVLPMSAKEWPRERLRVVLLHELAHVKRRDYLTQALVQGVCALYWFNPLVWLAARRLRAERERACDDVVLAAGMRGSDYARHLVEIARVMHGSAQRLLRPQLSVARRSQLEERLRAILNPQLQRSSARRTRVAVLAGVQLSSLSLTALELGPSAAADSQPSIPKKSISSAAAQPAEHPQQQTWPTEFRWHGQLAPGQRIEVRGMRGEIRAIASPDDAIRVRARISDPRARVRVVYRKSGVVVCTVLLGAGEERSACESTRRAASVEDGRGRVDFLVLVPSGVRFGGSIVEGDIEIDDPRSDVDVATLGGRVTVRLSERRGAEVLGNVIGGAVISDFALHDNGPPVPPGERATGHDAPRIVHAVIGTGGPVVRAAVINGSMWLRRR
jgi:beta-lactamase regulating signal transducer with metallopeptidase domain